MLAAALAVQLLARGAGVLHCAGPAAVAQVDLLALSLAVASVLTRWPSATGTRERVMLVAAAGAAVAVWWLSARPWAALPTLSLLAMLHNLTPVALVPRQANLGRWPARSVLAALFAGPLLMAVILAAAGYQPDVGVLPLPPEWQWADGALAAGAGGLLPALVWAQCLHYLAVIVLVPCALGGAVGQPPALRWILAGCGVLLFAFLWRFADTRGWYGVASGLHAWLEWPLVALWLAGRAPDAAAAEGAVRPASRQIPAVP